MNKWISTTKEMPGIGKLIKLKFFNGRVKGLCELELFSEGELIGWFNHKSQDYENAYEITYWKYLTPIEEKINEHWLNKSLTEAYKELRMIAK